MGRNDIKVWNTVPFPIVHEVVVIEESAFGVSKLPVNSRMRNRPLLCLR